MNKKVSKFISIILSAASLLCTSDAFAIRPTADNPMLLVVGNDTITRGEFEYMYNKNNGTALDGPMSVNEYLDLFIGYKRKAQDAVSQLLASRMAWYKQDYEAYSKQLVFPYMTNKEVEQDFVREAYERSKKKIQASHILISFKTPHAEDKIYKIYNQLKKGAKFADLAKQHSECGSAQNGGFLGWFTVFDMVYDFETAAYNTPIGEFSEPFKTQFGYHIVLVHDVAKVYTRARASEIFIANDSRNTPNTVDSLCALLRDGVKFEKLALKHSNKLGVDSTKGDLGWVTYKNTIGDMRDFIFAIPDVDSFRVYTSPMGKHILKLTEAVVADPLDSALYAQFSEKVMHGARYEAVKERVKKDVAARYGFKINYDMMDMFTNLSSAEPADFADSVSHHEGIVYEFNNDYVTTKDFLNEFTDFNSTYWRTIHERFNSSRAIKIDTTYTYRTNLINYITDKCETIAMALEFDKITKGNDTLQYQLSEYSDGLLVYGIMKEQVWDKGTTYATKSYLPTFFNDHKDEFTFDTARFVGVSIAFTDSLQMIKAKKHIEKFALRDTAIKRYLKDTLKLNSKNYFLKMGAWSKGQNLVCDRVIYGVKDTSAVYGKYRYFVCYGEMSTKPTSYEQMQGAVLSLYQKYEEERYNKYIAEKYPVYVDEKVLATVNNHPVVKKETPAPKEKSKGKKSKKK